MGVHLDDRGWHACTVGREALHGPPPGLHQMGAPTGYDVGLFRWAGGGGVMHGPLLESPQTGAPFDGWGRRGCTDGGEPWHLPFGSAPKRYADGRQRRAVWGGVLSAVQEAHRAVTRA